MKKKRIIISMLTLLCCCTGAWALDLDSSDGYYKIGSLQDWKDFATLVKTTPTANAKMTADVNLGNDQTTIPTYKGTFDGQGHTLTVDLKSTQHGYGPFLTLDGATIKNLHVTGTIDNSSYNNIGGIVGYMGGSKQITLTNCWSSVTLNNSNNIGNIFIGGMVGATTTTLNISDCLFDGNFYGPNNHNSTIWSGLVGTIYQATVNISNSLFIPASVTINGVLNTFAVAQSGSTERNCYASMAGSTSVNTQGTVATAEELADGSIAFKLQNYREDLVWGQLIGTDLAPVLTDNESYRVYSSKNGGYTNDPTEDDAVLQQDADGYYLIGSAQDWIEFATLVQTTPTANARMTADVDLGYVQTTIGTSTPYRGTFDGKGHTLTINFTVSSPFHRISNATIKNIHVAGTIDSSTGQSAPIGICSGSCTVENLWSSLTVRATTSDWQEAAGIVGLVDYSSNLTMKDCLFSGTITTSSDYNGCFVGYIHQHGSATITNCLSIGQFNYSGVGSGFRGTHINCYVKQFPVDYPDGVTKATDETLAEGSIAYMLQADREDLVWGQLIGSDTKPVQTNDESYRVYRSKNGGYTNDPTLAYSGIQQDADGNYLIGTSADWWVFADIVDITPTANAKMTADVDLGDNQKVVGYSTYFKGIFDGQGHTIKVNLTSTKNNYGLFCSIYGATIKNLRVTGTISTLTYNWIGGIVGSSYQTCTITNCRSSVTLNASLSGQGHHGGLVGFHSGTLDISDCIFDGVFESENTNGWGGLVGSNYGAVNINNCLFNPAGLNCSKHYSATFSGNGGTVSNSFYTQTFTGGQSVTQGKPATAEELANGTTTTALNNGRSEVFWVQDAVTNMPMLATFANAVTLTDETDLTALSAYAGMTCKVAYSRSFTNGKTSTVCLPFDYAKKASDGTFYTFTNIEKVNGEYIATMTEYTGDNLVANTPYLFTPSTTGDVDFSGTYTLPASITAGSTTSGDWTYLGTYKTISWTEAPTGIYGFSAQAVEEQGISQGQFVKVGAYVRIKPMRCYLKYKSGSANYAGARGMNRAADEELPETIKVRLIGADGEVTGIGSLQTKTGEVTFDKDAWYTLDGRRIEGKPTVKGIYVNNGKKVIIK